MNVKELVIVGEQEIGKTTLANALLGWDIFPQSTWDLYIPTEETASKMLTESIRLIDTPGYDLLSGMIRFSGRRKKFFIICGIVDRFPGCALKAIIERRENND